MKAIPWAFRAGWIVFGCVSLNTACASSDGSEQQLEQHSDRLIFNDETWVDTKDAGQLAKDRARAVGVLVANSTITPGTNLGTELLATQPSGLCADQKFDEQRASKGHCTAFYIGANKFLTAGHCIAPDARTDGLNCSELSVVLGWAVEPGQTLAESEIPQERILHCANLISHGGTLADELETRPCSSQLAFPNCTYDDDRFDWAVFEVEGTVSAAVVGEPLAISVPIVVLPGLPVTEIEHPQGLPQKVDEAGRVVPIFSATGLVPPTAAFQQWFRYESDSMKGSSGSPVIDNDTGAVLGIGVSLPDIPNQDWDPVIAAEGCKRNSRCGILNGGLVCDGAGAASAYNAFFPPRAANGFAPAPLQWESGLTLAVPGNWNNDATRDGLFFKRNVNSWSVSFRQRTSPNTEVRVDVGTVPIAAFFGGTPAPALFAAGNFDGDTLPDLLFLLDGVPFLFDAAAVSDFVAAEDPNFELESSGDLSFLEGRGFSSLLVEDVNGDLLQDLRAFDSLGDEFVFCGSATGLSETCTGAAGQVDIDADGDLDTIQLLKGGNNVSWRTRINPAVSSGAIPAGPQQTTAPYSEPILFAAGNFNGDTVTDSSRGLVYDRAEGAFISGGRPFYLLSTGFGGLAGRTLNVSEADVAGFGRRFTKLRVNDLDADGNDDLEALREDGTVTIYRGLAGVRDTSGGLQTAGREFTGLPTADAGDGKLLSISGQGHQTIDRPSTSLTVSVPANQTTFEVQIFDGDLGGMFDDTKTDAAHVCYRLVADPLKDGTGSQIVAEMEDTDFNDAAWTTLYAGPVHGDNTDSSALAPSGNFFYRLDAFLASGCDSTADAELEAINTWKVRTTGLVSAPVGEISLFGHDAAGMWSNSFRTWFVPNTDFDGTFDLYSDVRVSNFDMLLTEADADDLADEVPGRATGANEEIAYAVFSPSGVEALTVENPSGNYDLLRGDLDQDENSLLVDEPGLWNWFWFGVGSINNIHLWVPETSGEAVTHELFGLPREGLDASAALALNIWFAEAEESAPLLPVVLGTRTGNTLLGQSVLVSSVAEVEAILDDAEGTPRQQLLANLLTAKLNVRRGLTLGEALDRAFILGTAIPVSELLLEADADVESGASGEDVLPFLVAINRADVGYRAPGQVFPEDPNGDADSDGAPNVLDNCPEDANPDQLDSTGNGQGDVCECRLLSEAAPTVGNLKLLYKNGNPSTPLDNTINPNLRVVNTGSVPVRLEDVTLRYWYDNEASDAQQLWVDYAAVGSNNVLGGFARPSLTREEGDSYLRLGFATAAGVLQPGQSSGDIHVRFNAVGWPQLNELNDHSRGSNSVYLDWDRITVYINGLLVWGKEPLPAYCGGGPVNEGPSFQALYQPTDYGPTNSGIQARLSLFNTGGVAVPLSELTLRYWYSPEGTQAEQVNIDYATLGSQHIVAQSVVAASPKPGAERYVQVGFTASAGSLQAGASLGEIRARWNKSNWSNYNENDDYSFDVTRTELLPAQQVTVYRNGELVWGTEP